MSRPPAGPLRTPNGPALVTVVHAPACHLCDAAEAALAMLAAEHPLVVERVDIGSERGRALVRTHRSPMSPLVLLDGAFFSSGRLPRRKLAALLSRRASAQPATAMTAVVEAPAPAVAVEAPAPRVAVDPPASAVAVDRRGG